MDFSGKSVLITGGGRGIGLAVASRFLETGANVTIGGRDGQRLADASRALGGSGRLATVRADVGTVEGCVATAAAALEAFGRLDVLVANAGGWEPHPIEEMTEEAWDRTLDVHLKGTFFCVKAAVGALRAARGAVITMSSDAGILGLRGGWSAYCAAKSGLIGLTRQLAMDLAPEVRVNCIAPGPVSTEHVLEELHSGTYGGTEGLEDPFGAVEGSIPLRRLITPSEVADAVLFLASSEAMTGTVLSLDAGTTAGLP